MTNLQRERVEPSIAVLRLNRPAQRNALDSATVSELAQALEELALDKQLAVLVLSTTDARALCAGADVSEPLDHQGGVARMEGFSRLYSTVEAFPVPTVCVCVGNVVGAGAELAVGCDLRVGGDNLKLAWAGARLGVPVGPARLTPLVGHARARDLIFTGRVIDMHEAHALGLLHRTAPAARAEAAALELARAVAANDSAGLRRLKQMFRDFEGLTMSERVARENEILTDWQRHGPGLPDGGV